jgi:hypothetical protein
MSGYPSLAHACLPPCLPAQKLRDELAAKSTELAASQQATMTEKQTLAQRLRAHAGGAWGPCSVSRFHLKPCQPTQAPIKDLKSRKVHKCKSVEQQWVNKRSLDLINGDLNAKYCDLRS